MVRLFATVAMLLCSQCHADLIIQVQDAQLVYGSEGFIDILISSSGTDNLMNFSAVVQSSTPDNLHGGIRFVSPVIDASTITAAGGYVFLGDSSLYDVATPSGFPSTEVTVSDSTASLTDVALGSTFKLLTRLKISHHNGVSAGVGDTFEIDFLDSSPVTSFFDAAGNTLSIDVSNLSTRLTGTVTIVTPEPSTVGLLLVGVVGIAGLRLRRSRLLSTVAQRSAA